MSETFRFRFDARRSRAGRVHLDVKRVSETSTGDDGFTPLRDALFTASTTLGLAEFDRNLLCVAPAADLKLLPHCSGDEGTELLPLPLDAELQASLGQFILIAVSAGQPACEFFRVLGNTLLLPSTDQRRRGPARTESATELGRIRVGTLLRLSGNRFTSAEANCVVAVERCRPDLLVFEFESFAAIGGFGVTELRKLAATVFAEAVAATTTSPALTVLKVSRGSDGTNRKATSPAWIEALMTNKLVTVLAEEIPNSGGENGAQLCRVVGTRRSAIPAGTTFSLIPTVSPTMVTPVGGKPISVTEWLGSASATT